MKKRKYVNLRDHSGLVDEVPSGAYAPNALGNVWYKLFIDPPQLQLIRWAQAALAYFNYEQ